MITSKAWIRGWSLPSPTKRAGLRMPRNSDARLTDIHIGSHNAAGMAEESTELDPYTISFGRNMVEAIAANSALAGR
ncbi:MAG TPA: hypothetical protein VHS28_10835 [Chloroflexota bacterium]|nr:hypothetical protein [Chloroflexota bacterium]